MYVRTAVLYEYVRGTKYSSCGAYVCTCIDGQVFKFTPGSSNTNTVADALTLWRSDEGAALGRRQQQCQHGRGKGCSYSCALHHDHLGLVSVVYARPSPRHDKKGFVLYGKDAQAQVEVGDWGV